MVLKNADSLSYLAFVSYSHTDRRAAEKLLRKLQTYRLPKAIDAGEQKALGPFFMDRESLPAADSLSAAIQGGLKASRAMIVLCSTASANSDWVNREVATFRNLHPGAPVFPVIINDDDAAADPLTLFPSELLQSDEEPLAADLRRSGDGYQLGFLKLVAALTDVPLSQLLQKDAKRRNRRVTAVTATSAIVATMMMSLAWQANSARQEADTRRAEVEGMVDFMLNDLKAQLEPVGRLEALSGVADEAIAYYDKQDTDKLDCDAAVRSAHAFHLKTQIHLNRNELDQTSASAQRALDLIKAKKADCGNIPEFMVADGHSEYWAASPIWRRIAAVERGAHISEYKYTQLLNSLLPYYHRYDAAISPLAALPDQYELFAQEAADNAINFGSVHIKLGQYDEALNYFDIAIENIRQITLVNGEVPTDPALLDARKTALLTLANALGWRAGLLEGKFEHSDAISAREREALITFRLANAQSKNRDLPALFQSLQAEMAILRLRAKMSDPSLSARDFIELERSISELTESDPSNESWKDLLKETRRIRVALFPRSEKPQATQFED